MSGDEAPRVVIVGAGPAGLAAALEMARRDIIPRIIDKSSGPTAHSRAGLSYAEDAANPGAFRCDRAAAGSWESA